MGKQDAKCGHLGTSSVGFIRLSSKFCIPNNLMFFVFDFDGFWGDMMSQDWQQIEFQLITQQIGYLKDDDDIETNVNFYFFQRSIDPSI